MNTNNSYSEYGNPSFNTANYRGPQRGGPLEYNRYQKMASNNEDNQQSLMCNSYNTVYTKVQPSFMDDSVNFDNMNYSTYNNNISNPPTKDTNVEYEYEKTFIFITSEDRDRSLYPSPANFKIDLPECLCNVKSVSIAGGTLPNLDGISADPFLYLDIPELNHITTTSNDKYFGILSLHTGNTVNFFNLDKSSTNVMAHTFTPVKQTVKSIHVRLYHPNHTSVNFGTQSELDALDYTKQTTFVFQVITRKKKRLNLESDYRNF